MLPTWLFESTVPSSHVDVVELLAAHSHPHAQVAWAFNPQSSDRHAIATYTTVSARDFSSIYTMQPPDRRPLSDQVVSALRSRKRLSVLRWAASQQISDDSALALAVDDEVCAAHLMAASTTAPAVKERLVTFEHGMGAAQWMLESGDFQHLDSLNPARLRGREGTSLRALLAALFPDRFEWLRSGGQSGDWMAAGSALLTFSIARELVSRRPGTIVSATWNPKLSPDNIRELIALLPPHDTFLTSRAYTALESRESWYPQHTSDYRSESCPEILQWLVRRTCKPQDYPVRRADLLLLLDNPHVDERLRDRVVDTIGDGWEQTPTAFNAACFQRLEGQVSTNRAGIADLARQLASPPLPPPVAEPDGDAEPVGTTRPLREVGHIPLRSANNVWRDAAGFLFTALPPEWEVWDTASLMWDTVDTTLSLQEFAHSVLATRI